MENLRQIRHKILGVCGVIKLKISPKLITEAKNIHAKDKSHFEQKETMKEKKKKNVKNKKLQM